MLVAFDSIDEVVTFVNQYIPGFTRIHVISTGAAIAFMMRHFLPSVASRTARRYPMVTHAFFQHVRSATSDQTAVQIVSSFLVFKITGYYIPAETAKQFETGNEHINNIFIIVAILFCFAKWLAQLDPTQITGVVDPTKHKGYARLSYVTIANVTQKVALVQNGDWYSVVVEKGTEMMTSARAVASTALPGQVVIARLTPELMKYEVVGNGTIIKSHRGETFLLTADHVLFEENMAMINGKEVVKICSNDKITLGDVAVIAVSNDQISRLKVRAAAVAPLDRNHPIVFNYTLDGGRTWMISTTFSGPKYTAEKRYKFALEHGASTVPGSSGAAGYQHGKVVCIHNGSVTDGRQMNVLSQLPHLTENKSSSKTTFGAIIESGLMSGLETTTSYSGSYDDYDYDDLDVEETLRLRTMDDKAIKKIRDRDVRETVELASAWKYGAHANDDRYRSLEDELHEAESQGFSKGSDVQRGIRRRFFEELDRLAHPNPGDEGGRVILDLGFTRDERLSINKPTTIKSVLAGAESAKERIMVDLLREQAHTVEPESPTEEKEMRAVGRVKIAKNAVVKVTNGTLTINTEKPKVRQVKVMPDERCQTLKNLVEGQTALDMINDPMQKDGRQAKQQQMAEESQDSMMLLALEAEKQTEEEKMADRMFALANQSATTKLYPTSWVDGYLSAKRTHALESQKRFDARAKDLKRDRKELHEEIQAMPLGFKQVKAAAQVLEIGTSMESKLLNQLYEVQKELAEFQKMHRTQVVENRNAILKLQAQLTEKLKQPEVKNHPQGALVQSYLDKQKPTSGQEKPSNSHSQDAPANAERAPVKMKTIVDAHLKEMARPKGSVEPKEQKESKVSNTSSKTATRLATPAVSGSTTTTSTTTTAPMRKGPAVSTKLDSVSVSRNVRRRLRVKSISSELEKQVEEKEKEILALKAQLSKGTTTH